MSNNSKTINEAVTRMGALINHLGIEFNSFLKFMADQGIKLDAPGPPPLLDQAVLDRELGTVDPDEPVVDAVFATTATELYDKASAELKAVAQTTAALAAAAEAAVPGSLEAQIERMRGGSTVADGAPVAVGELIQTVGDRPYNPELATLIANTRIRVEAGTKEGWLRAQETMDAYAAGSLDTKLSEAEVGSHTLAAIRGERPPAPDGKKMGEFYRESVDDTAKVVDMDFGNVTDIKVYRKGDPAPAPSPEGEVLRNADGTEATIGVTLTDLSGVLHMPVVETTVDHKLSDRLLAYAKSNEGIALSVAKETHAKLTPEVQALYSVDTRDLGPYVGDSVFQQVASPLSSVEVSAASPVSDIAAALMLDTFGSNTIGDGVDYAAEAAAPVSEAMVTADQANAPNKFKYYEQMAFRETRGMFRHFFTEDVIDGGKGSIGTEVTNKFISAQRYREDILMIGAARTSLFPIGMYRATAGGYHLYLPTDFPRASETKINLLFTGLESDDYKVYYTKYDEQKVPTFVELDPKDEHAETIFLIVMDTLRAHQLFNKKFKVL